MRGFFGGLIIGLVTVVIAVVALSLLSPVLQRPDVAVDAPSAATGGAQSAGQSGAQTGTLGTGADADLAELAPAAPTRQQGQSDNLGSLEGADTRPADKPSVGESTTGLADPRAAPQVPVVEGNNDAPVTPLAPSDAPRSPQGDIRPTALADPAQPEVPDVSQTGSGFGTGSQPSGEETAPRVATNSDARPSTDGAGPGTQAPGVGSNPAPSTQSTPPPEASTGPAPAAGGQTAIAPETTPRVGDVPQSAPQTTPPVAAVPVPELDRAAPAEPDPPEPAQDHAGPQIAALPQAGAEPVDQGPRIGRRIVPLTERGETTVSKASGDTTAQPADPVAGPPIKAFGVPFENPDNRPVMAIVLIDDDAGLGGEALAEFPYPLTFAIDPSAPDAAAKMARHRAAGHEVVALIDLPNAATAQDAEVSLSVWLDALPQVVALLEGTGSGVQGNRELSDQVTAIAASTGLGLIMQAKGLNTAQKLAAREGVPSAIVFRDFDGAGQTPVVMRRFLDQAAFRAGQQGGVIMLGRLRPDTISALLLWGLQDRASRLALAPVSAVLMRRNAAQ